MFGNILKHKFERKYLSNGTISLKKNQRQKHKAKNLNIYKHTQNVLYSRKDCMYQSINNHPMKTCYSLLKEQEGNANSREIISVLHLYLITIVAIVSSDCHVSRRQTQINFDMIFRVFILISVNECRWSSR